MRAFFLIVLVGTWCLGCLDFEKAREQCIEQGDCLGTLVAPSLTEVSPPNQATEVALGTVLSVTFSREMDVGSVNLVIAPPVGLGSRQWNEIGTAFLVHPTSPLQPSTEYVVSVSGRARDGVPLGEEARFGFTTAAPQDTQPPRLVATSPQAASINVPVDFKVSVTFSEPMDPASLAVTSQPDHGWGNPTWSQDQQTATFHSPTSALAESTDYALQVEALDLAGNPLTGLKTFSFRTAKLPDTTAPQVIAHVPAPGAVNVPIGVQPSVTFSEPMNAATVSTAWVVTPAIPGGCTMAPDATGTLFTCQHGQPLAGNTQYTVTIGTTAADGSGNPLAQPFSYSFTTGAVPDVTAPTVITSAPVHNATGIAQRPTIVVTFSEPMDPGATQSAFSLAQPNNAGAGTFSWDATGTVMTYTFPTAYKFPYGQLVIAQVGVGAKDLAGNAMTQVFTLHFQVRRETTVELYADSSGNYDDGYIDSHALPFPYPVNETTLRVGNNSANRDVRAFVSFNLSSLPTSLLEISSSTLTLRQSSVQNTPYSAARIYVFGIDAGAGGLGTAVFNATPMCPSATGRDCSIAGFCDGVLLSSSSALQDYSSGVTGLVKKGYAGTNKRITFRVARRAYAFNLVGCPDVPAEKDSENDYAFFISSEAASHRPKLTVTYTHP